MKTQILFLLLILPQILSAQVPCSFDNSFSIDGKEISDGNRMLENIVALSGGKSIVAYNSFGNGHVYLRRLNSDGSVDNTFGTAGKTIIQIAAQRTEVKSMLVYNDQIYCCGSTSTGSDTYPFYARMSIDGMPDVTFGNNGINTNQQHFTYNSMIIEPGSGKILIAGMKGTSEIVVVRIHTTGFADAAFGNLGEATFATGVSGEYYETRHINLDKNNKIILTGKYYATQGVTFSKTFIARLNSNGSKDNSFNNDGIAYYNSAANNYDEGRRIFANTANDYFVCGATWRANQDYDYCLLKVKSSNATPDNTFDLDGWKLYDLAGTSPEEYLLNGIMLQNENILLTGNQGEGDTVYFCMLMVKPDGTPDNNFAPNGIYKHIFGVNNNNSSSGLALSNDGKIYLGGYTRTCANGTCGPLSSGIARYAGGQVVNGIVPQVKQNSMAIVYPTMITENQWINITGEDIDASSIQVCDINGRLISFDYDQHKIKLKNTVPGLYFINIKNEQLLQTVKIIQTK